MRVMVGWRPGTNGSMDGGLDGSSLLLSAGSGETTMFALAATTTTRPVVRGVDGSEVAADAALAAGDAGLGEGSEKGKEKADGRTPYLIRALVHLGRRGGHAWRR